MFLSEVLPDSQAAWHREKAIRNVKRTYTYDEVTQMDWQYFLEPRHYIQEHITGTHILEERLNKMMKK